MHTDKRTPWIGITTRHGRNTWLRRNTRNYIDMVTEYGATPIILAPDTPAVLPDGTAFTPDALGRMPEAVLDRLDGLILSGGGDVHPRYFGADLAGAERRSIDVKRDELELSLSSQALGRDLPIFGICRGCQVLNVAAGGSMIQHLEGHRSPADRTAYHGVTVERGSYFAQIVGSDVFPVNTFHHQGMDHAALAPVFAPVALAEPDAWLVEAYESPQHRWVVGVQWHPERLFELVDEHRRLWDSFFAACGR